MKGIWKAAAELEAQQIPFVVVTLVSSRGHAPQDPGAKAVVTAEGLVFGTVGGGKVEARAILYAQEILRSEKKAPEALTWNLQKDIGMTCGGEVTYLFEPQRVGAWHVMIFGAGHVAQALVRALLPLDVRVDCVDSREEWVARLPESPQLFKKVLSDPASHVACARGHEFFLSVTQGHAADVPVLEAIFRRFPKPRYIGVIGSETKGLKIRAELRERGIAEEPLKLLRCPVGLPIGSNHPGEIAVSILAELLQVRDESMSEVSTTSG